MQRKAIVVVFAYPKTYRRLEVSLREVDLELRVVELGSLDSRIYIEDFSFLPLRIYTQK
jgi:hypothetical protein